MILYPAIDLKAGQCVRLEQGDMGRATIFNDAPAAQAQEFAAQGFSHLHIVDLDGAFSGAPQNRAAVEAILKVSELEVQLGGGVRDLATLEGWLAAGVARVILGTAAVREPEFVVEACRKFPGRVIVGIDARGGEVAVSGWAKQSEMGAAELAARFIDVGVAAIIYTDIERDGLLGGINIAATRELAAAVGGQIPLIASGGLRDLGDVEALLEYEAEGIGGVICGRALYDGRLDAAAALALVAGSGEASNA